MFQVYWLEIESYLAFKVNKVNQIRCTFCDKTSTIDKTQVSSLVECSFEHFNFYRLVQWNYITRT